MITTHKDGVEASVYVFPVIQFLVDVLLHTNTASGGRFFPVNLLLVSQGISSDARNLLFR